MTPSVYDVNNTPANIDLNLARVLVLGGLALVFNFIYFGTAIYQGFKHKVGKRRMREA